VNEQNLYYKGVWMVFTIDINLNRTMCECGAPAINHRFHTCEELFKMSRQFVDTDDKDLKIRHLNKIRNAKGKAKE